MRRKYTAVSKIACRMPICYPPTRHVQNGHSDVVCGLPRRADFGCRMTGGHSPLRAGTTRAVVLPAEISDGRWRPHRTLRSPIPCRWHLLRAFAFVHTVADALIIVVPLHKAPTIGSIVFKHNARVADPAKERSAFALAISFVRAIHWCVACSTHCERHIILSALAPTRSFTQPSRLEPNRPTFEPRLALRR